MQGAPPTSESAGSIEPGVRAQTVTGHVDVALGEELHRAELVARARDRERRVEHRDAHQVELTHDGEAVVRDRRADAREHEVGVRGGPVARGRATADRAR